MRDEKEQLDPRLLEQFKIWDNQKIFSRKRKQWLLLKQLLLDSSQERFENDPDSTGAIVENLYSNLWKTKLDEDSNPSEASRRLVAEIRNNLNAYYESEEGKNALVGIIWQELWPKIEYRKDIPKPAIFNETTLGNVGRTSEWSPSGSEQMKCYRIPGGNAAGVKYLVSRYRTGSVVAVWDTHVRVDDHARKYDRETLALMREGVGILLKQESKIVEIFGKKIDDQLVREYIVAAKKSGRLKDGFECYRLPNEMPVMNFHILDYAAQPDRAKYSEVLFGWSRHSVGEQEEAVFRSEEPDLVEEFKKLFEALRRASKPLSSLRDLLSPLPRREHSPVIVHPEWAAADPNFEELLRSVKPSSDPKDRQDLRINTISFTSGVPTDIFLYLVEHGVRINILLTDPWTPVPGQVPELLINRNKIRRFSKDGKTPEVAHQELCEQIKHLSQLVKSVKDLRRKGTRGDLEFRLTDLMPYGFISHCSNWAALGLFVATGSYGSGPMIMFDAEENEATWESLKREWKLRWECTSAFDEEAFQQGVPQPIKPFRKKQLS